MKQPLMFVGAYPGPATLERYVSGDLATRLESREWEILLTSRSRSRLGRFSEILWDLWRTRRAYRLACVDVFSGPAFRWAEAACQLLRKLEKPYVLTLHGGSLPEFSQKHPERVRQLLTSAMTVTCPSLYLRAELEHLHPNIILIPNGLDLARYRFRERSEPLRHIIWLRAFHDIYEPELAVEVLARLRLRYPDVRLTMVGPDKGDGSLESTQAAARRLGVDSAVTFLGSIAKHDVPALLDSGDVFLNTTRFDNTPVSVLEAMACGLPVVTTNVGGLPYLLKNRITALLVPPSDPEMMTCAVDDVLSSSRLRSQLVTNAREMVGSFDWETVLPQWETVLQLSASVSKCSPG